MIEVDIEIRAYAPLTQEGKLEVTYPTRPIRTKGTKLVDEATGDVVWEFQRHFKTYYVGDEYVKTLFQ